MFHRSLPSDPGYYWIAEDFESDEGSLAYLDRDAEPMRLVVFLPGNKRAGVSRHATLWVYDDAGGMWLDQTCEIEPHRAGRWAGPVAWIGPLHTPFGPFSSACAYAEAETYLEAESRHEAIRIDMIDHDLCKPLNRGGTVTTVTILPGG